MCVTLLLGGSWLQVLAEWPFDAKHDRLLVDACSRGEVLTATMRAVLYLRGVTAPVVLESDLLMTVGLAWLAWWRREWLALWQCD